jgi:hypothetical protein
MELCRECLSKMEGHADAAGTLRDLLPEDT